MNEHAGGIDVLEMDGSIGGCANQEDVPSNSNGKDVQADSDYSLDDFTGATHMVVGSNNITDYVGIKDLLKEGSIVRGGGELLTILRQPKHQNNRRGHVGNGLEIGDRGSMRWAGSAVGACTRVGAGECTSIKDVAGVSNDLHYYLDIKDEPIINNCGKTWIQGGDTLEVTCTKVLGVFEENDHNNTSRCVPVQVGADSNGCDDADDKWSYIRNRLDSQNSYILHEVVIAWLVQVHKAQLKKYQKIMLCLKVVKKWKKFFHQIVFCRQIIYRQLLFWFCLLQVRTYALQKKCIQGSWHHNIVKRVFKAWKERFDNAHNLNRTQWQQMFTIQDKLRKLTWCFTAWFDQVGHRNFKPLVLQQALLQYQGKLKLINQVFRVWQEHTFLYENADKLQDHHETQHTCLTPAEIFRQSAQYLALRSKLRRILTQFRHNRLTDRAWIFLLQHYPPKEKPHTMGREDHTPSDLKKNLSSCIDFATPRGGSIDSPPQIPSGLNISNGNSLNKLTGNPMGLELGIAIILSLVLVVVAFCEISEQLNHIHNLVSIKEVTSQYYGVFIGSERVLAAGVIMASASAEGSLEVCADIQDCAKAEGRLGASNSDHTSTGVEGESGVFNMSNKDRGIVDILGTGIGSCNCIGGASTGWAGHICNNCAYMAEGCRREAGNGPVSCTSDNWRIGVSSDTMHNVCVEYMENMSNGVSSYSGDGNSLNGVKGTDNCVGAGRSVEVGRVPEECSYGCYHMSIENMLSAGGKSNKSASIAEVSSVDRRACCSAVVVSRANKDFDNCAGKDISGTGVHVVVDAGVKDVETGGQFTGWVGVKDLSGTGNDLNDWARVMQLSGTYQINNWTGNDTCKYAVSKTSGIGAIVCDGSEVINRVSDSSSDCAGIKVVLEASNGADDCANVKGVLEAEDSVAPCANFRARPKACSKCDYWNYVQDGWRAGANSWNVEEIVLEASSGVNWGEHIEYAITVVGAGGSCGSTEGTLVVNKKFSNCPGIKGGLGVDNCALSCVCENTLGKESSSNNCVEVWGSSGAGVGIYICSKNMGCDQCLARVVLVMQWLALIWTGVSIVTSVARASGTPVLLQQLGNSGAKSHYNTWLGQAGNVKTRQNCIIGEQLISKCRSMPNALAKVQTRDSWEARDGWMALTSTIAESISSGDTDWVQLAHLDSDLSAAGSVGVRPNLTHNLVRDQTLARATMAMHGLVPIWTGICIAASLLEAAVYLSIFCQLVVLKYNYFNWISLSTTLYIRQFVSLSRLWSKKRKKYFWKPLWTIYKIHQSRVACSGVFMINVAVGGQGRSLTTAVESSVKGQLDSFGLGVRSPAEVAPGWIIGKYLAGPFCDEVVGSCSTEIPQCHYLSLCSTGRLLVILELPVHSTCLDIWVAAGICVSPDLCLMYAGRRLLPSNTPFSLLWTPGACEIELVAHQRAGGKNMGSCQDQEPTIEIEDTATTQQETISGGNLGQRGYQQSGNTQGALLWEGRIGAPQPKASMTTATLQVVPANQGRVARVPVDDGYNGDVSSSAVAATSQPPSPRVLRQRKRKVPCESEGGTVIRVYKLGYVPSTDQDDWLQQLDVFHRDKIIHELVAEATANSKQYLQEQEIEGVGRGLVAAQQIPVGVTLGFYSGILAMALPEYASNYVMELGKYINGYQYRVDIDGHPSINLWGGKMPLLNHSCHANCDVEYVDTCSGIGLVIFKSRVAIQQGQEATIKYGGGHWSHGEQSKHIRAGCKRIFCRCNGNQPCPNGLWRDEIDTEVAVLPSIAPKQVTQVEEAGSEMWRSFVTVGELASGPTVSSSLHASSKLKKVDVECTIDCPVVTGNLTDGAPYSGLERPPADNLELGSCIKDRSCSGVANHPLQHKDQACINSVSGPMPEQSDKVAPTPVAQSCSLLYFSLIDEQHRAVPPNVNVNSQPFGRISGDVIVQHNRKHIVTRINDEVHAVRGEGSCFNLCVLHQIQKAEAVESFRRRRQADPQLQGVFRERWETLAAMTGDNNAEGMRVCLCTHIFQNLQSFQRIFTQLPDLSQPHLAERWKHMQAFAATLGCHCPATDPLPAFPDPLLPAKMWAILYLHQSTHTDDRFVAALVSWFDQKVAFTTLVQVPDHARHGVHRYYHSCMFDQFPDSAVLWMKFLNQETHGANRDGLNHYNCVYGQQVVGFIVDLLDHVAVGAGGLQEQRAVMADDSDLDPLVPVEASCINALWLRVDNLVRVQPGPHSQYGGLQSTGPPLHGLFSKLDGYKKLLASVQDQEGSNVNWQSHSISSPELLLSAICRIEGLVGNFKSQLSVAVCAAAPGRQLAVAEQTFSDLSDQVGMSLWGLEQELCYTLKVLFSLDNILPIAIVLEVEQVCKAVAAILPATLTWMLWKRLHLLRDFYRIQVAQLNTLSLAECCPKHQITDWPWGDLCSTMNPELLECVRNTSTGLKRNALGSVLDSFHNILSLRARENAEVAAAVQSLAPLKYLGFLPRAISNPPPGLLNGEFAGLAANTNCLLSAAQAAHAVALPHQGHMGAAVTEPVDKVTAQGGCRNLECVIPSVCRIPGLAPWVPGTTGLYARPSGSVPPGEKMCAFPVWNIKEQGVRLQQAMFNASDRIAHSAFYVAADVWTKKQPSTWAVGKVFGAFGSVQEFITQMLQGAPTRCFYEIIRAERACKAYFDLEAEAGAMTPEQGHAMCQRVITAWEQHMQSTRPLAVATCPKCVEALVLDGSRHTVKGWKVSYHLIYPWLTFPCNTAALKKEAIVLSTLPQLQYTTAGGETRSFVDPAVYSRNRQFRLPLSWKLTDNTCTPLWLPGAQSVSTFLLACITRTEEAAWLVPAEQAEGNLDGCPAQRPKQPKFSRGLENSSHGLKEAMGRVQAALLHLLAEAGQPPGRLAFMNGSTREATFRWQTNAARPCSVAQIWRPGNPTHDSNGALVSYNAECKVYLKCLHPRCRCFCSGDGQFLGCMQQLPVPEGEPVTVLVGESPPSINRPVASGRKRALDGRDDQPSRLASQRTPPVSAGGNQLEASRGVEVATVGEGTRWQDQEPGWTESSVEPLMLGKPSSLGGDNPSPTAHTEVQEAVRRAPLTLQQCLRQVFSDNQIVDGELPVQESSGGQSNCRVSEPLGSFSSSCWLSQDSPCHTQPELQAASGPTAAPAGAIQGWLDSVPFVCQPPDQLVSALGSVLKADNLSYSTQQAGILSGWDDVIREEHNGAEASVLEEPYTPSPHQWEVLPPSEWFESPLGSRAPVGRTLVTSARIQLDARPLEAGPQLLGRPDLWDSPFAVGFINVGFRGLACSMCGLVNLVERHRPDILFLGDLRTPRNKIGKQRAELEASLGEEWTLLTDIRAPPGRPVGIGAVVHSAVARHTKQLEVPCPPGLDQAQWASVVQGRILLLQLTRPELPHTWWFVGLYQYVVSEATEQARNLIFKTLGHIKMLAAASGHYLIIAGDANAAPAGGRWGYSISSRTWKADEQVAMWLQDVELGEVQNWPPKATWRACLCVREAVLDRAWVYPTNLPISQLYVFWAPDRHIFDHAMILLRLPQSAAGIGYAGACRPLRQAQPLPRCLADPKVLAKRLDEWNQLVCEGLAVLRNQANQLDPFQALHQAESVADMAARALAPRRLRRLGETRRRPFEFDGHKVLFRELNLLHLARALVHSAIHDPGGLGCNPHRTAVWNSVVGQLNTKLRHSKYCLPPRLCGPVSRFLSSQSRQRLQDWLVQAKEAIDVRQAAIRERIAKAKYLNVQQLRALLIARGGAVDSRMVQAALGKRQPCQRMWGVSGSVKLGVSIAVTSDSQCAFLEFLSTIDEVEAVQKLVGDSSGIQLWFRGPRPLGDFLARWCALAHAWKYASLHTLAPEVPYIAIVPDDMLAVQELHMATEGMDSESVCIACHQPGVQPIITQAVGQKHGNTRRAVLFFCAKCVAVHDDVAIADLPPCPVPLKTWQALRKIPPGLQPLINRPVDFDTLAECVRQLPLGKSPGTDGIPYEYYIHAPRALLEFLLAAVNAFIQGEKPTVGEEDWTGGLVTLVDKVPAAVAMTDRRPLANLCTKYKVATKIINKRFTQALEDYAILDEAQEGCRRHRSAKRQLSKLQCILDEGRRCGRVSVVLYLDLKNAFNAVNHRAIFLVLEAYGFPHPDIDLFRRLYTGTWFSVGNPFGETAACYLRRGVKQGDVPSPNIFDSTVNPLLKTLRDNGRGCSLPCLSQPTGASGFVDDTNLHTDGPDAIPAMQTMVEKVGGFCCWVGIAVNMSKSCISAIDFSTGEQVSTNSITLNGLTFPAIPPNCAHKYLGVRVTLTGDFSAEKTHVLGEMELRLKALREDKVLSPPQKEMVIAIGIASVFRYSAGLVPWTQSELDKVTRIWAKGYKHAWRLPSSLDSAVMILSQQDGGRGCQVAVEVWVNDVLELLDQCIRLPGEVACLTLHRLQQACQDQGCATLCQLQRLLRIGGQAHSVVELLLVRLDELGLEVSSPWTSNCGQLIMVALWPQLLGAWKTRAIGTGSPSDWIQALNCARTLRQLVSAGISTVAQLQGPGQRWLAWREVAPHRVSEQAYQTLIQWLSKHQELDRSPGGRPGPIVHDDSVSPSLEPNVCAAPVLHRRVSVSCGRWRSCQAVTASLVQWPTMTVMLPPQPPIPPCIKGVASSTAQHDCVVLNHMANAQVPETPLCSVADGQLGETLCRFRAVFSFTLNGNDHLTVECLAPLDRVWQPLVASSFIVVQDATAGVPSGRLAALSLAFVRDCFMASAVETLKEACARPPWTVAREELQKWFNMPRDLEGRSGRGQWVLGTERTDGQRTLQGITRGVLRRRREAVWRPLAMLHPWQSDPPLPDLVTVDLSNHYPRSLPAPAGWEILQRNARVLISTPSQRVFQLHMAQYGMLVALVQQTAGPTEHFLETLCASCLAQEQADASYQVHWSRHFLACICTITGVELLVGARAVTYNPHFQQFYSPSPGDVQLGGVDQWPPVPALLLLDSFDPDTRHGVLQQAFKHPKEVWVLRQNSPLSSSAADMRMLTRLGARLCAQLPKKSLIHHSVRCWSESSWDTVPAQHSAQVWLLGNFNSVNSKLLLPLALQQALGDWQIQRYDFHWREGVLPLALQLHRANQQDAIQYTWLGWVAGTDGSVNYKQERMGAGYAVGVGPVPLLELSAPVGGPLSTLRSEAASLHALLLKTPSTTDLLVFIDSLVLLLILKRWGYSDFWPDPGDLAHFDVIIPILALLRSRTGRTVLFKIKSHSGCLQNELADERASLGCVSKEEELCPGPEKYCSLGLSIRAACRERFGANLPRDSAPNKSILARVVAANILLAVKSRSTIFVRSLFHSGQGTVIARSIQRCSVPAIRCWIKAMSGIYPTAAYLYRIGKTQSSVCPHCAMEATETLGHFACVCPRFREARTAAHDKAWGTISSFIASRAGNHWQFYWDTPLMCTGLELSPVRQEQQQEGCVELRPTSNLVRVDNLRPDGVAVSVKNKRIGILEFCRPSDSFPDQLKAAHDRKNLKYAVVEEALRLYSTAGWQVKILPWVVGIRGLVIEDGIHSALEFIGLQRKDWAAAVTITVVASVESLAFMHRVRFSSICQSKVFDTNDPGALKGTGSTSYSRVKKRPVDTASDLQETQARWKRMAANPGWHKH